MKSNEWIMSFDYGDTRIGVAVANATLKIPHPVETVFGRNKFEKLDKIAKLIDKWRPTQLVVGMPSYDSILDEHIEYRVKRNYQEPEVDEPVKNQKEELIKSITKFANRLKNKFKLPVTFVNEDYTSSIGVHKLNEQAIRGIAQKVKLDMIAACLIMQYYFDSMEKLSDDI